MFKKATTKIENSQINLQQMCRLCLSTPTENDLIDIFDNNEKISISVRIMACVSLEVQNTDTFPKHICSDCRYMLEKCYYFRTKSKNSDAKIKRHLRLINAGKTSNVFDEDFDEFEDDYSESLQFFENYQEKIEKRLQDLEVELKSKLEKEMEEALNLEKQRVREEETKRIFVESKAVLLADHKKKKDAKFKKFQAKIMSEIFEIIHDDEIETLAPENDQEIMTIENEEHLQSDHNTECDENYKIIYKDTENGRYIFDMERCSEDEVTPKENNSAPVPKSNSYKRVTRSSKQNPQTNKKRKTEYVEEISEEQIDQIEDVDEDSIVLDLVQESDESEFAASSGEQMKEEEILILEENLSCEEENEIEYKPADENQNDNEEEEEESYYVEDEDEMVVEQDMLEAEEENVHIESDSERNKFEIESITEAVKNTLQLQHPDIQINDKFELKIQKITTGLTKVEVKTAEGSVILMEFLGKLEMDVETDENGEKKIFRCGECPKTFARRTQLARHVSTHLKHKGYICEHCEKWCPTKSALERHRRVHTGEKPFSCGVCGRAFIQKEILKRHMMVHSGEKPFECPHCEMKYIQRDMLRQHINRKHTENPVIELHKCTICPKTFCHASGLSRHAVVHSGKTYECEVCKKHFTDKSALKRHIQNVHLSKKTTKKT